MTLKDQLTPEQIEAAAVRLQAALESSAVPEHLHDGLVRYVEWGILPGSFMQAVLCGDLEQAITRADPSALQAIVYLHNVLYDYAPRQAWGSRERVLAWTTTPDRLEV